MNRNARQHNGFTLVELMLSMTFISVMLLAIAFCIIQMSTIYARGETLRQVNQASRVLADDMRRSFASADYNKINTTKIGKGRLCLGSFSYIWNVNQAGGNSSGEDAQATNNQYQATPDTPLRLVRVTDPDGLYCRDVADASTSEIHENSSIRASARPVELLQDDAGRLKIYRLRVTSGLTAAEAKQRLYVIAISLGSSDRDAAITTTRECLPPRNEDGSINQDSNLEYCAINELSFTVRAGMR